MMDIWSWICEIPNSDGWDESDSALIFELASSKSSQDGPTRAIQLKAERTAGSNSEALVTFTICLQGFHPFDAPKTLWVSDTCPLNSEKPFLPLVLQLLQEIIARSPTAHNSTCPRSQLQKLKPDPVSWIMDSHTPESFSSFFSLVFITRLFWLCAFDAPTEAGSLCFESVLGPHLETLSCKQAPVLRTFLLTVGVDAELCFMRAMGYMLAKWLILREVGVGLQTLAPSSQQVGLSYATEAYGLWVLKGYAPILAMNPTCPRNNKFCILEAKDTVLKYALAHHQLEAVIQLEYAVRFYDGYIQVNARVNNLRFHVVRLGFKKNEGVDYDDERHFVSRARVWVGPEIGATYVGGLCLGRSTYNGEKEVEVQRILKGSYGEAKVPQVKTRSGMATKTRMKSWRCDQDVEGNAVVFDAVLYDNMMGQEVATRKPIGDGNAVGVGGRNGKSFGTRCNGPNRPFTKTGGVVFAGDEYGEGVEWRLSKETEGSVLKWRLGGQVWVSYCPSEVKSSHFETRSVEWCDEVDLPIIPAK